MTEKELILTTVKQCRRVDLYIDPLPLTPEQQFHLKEIHSRRQQGEPIQYILGSCEFLGIPLRVDSRVLVPRPETELLVETAVNLIREFKKTPARVLDLGTGSGNIAISLAKMVDSIDVTAVDISAEALALAKENAGDNGVLSKIKFVESDLFMNLKNHLLKNQLFDIIVSNPPYILTSQISELPSDVQHEPLLALDGGADGLKFYRRILAEAPAFLKAGGKIVWEIGDNQAESICELILRNRKLCHCEPEGRSNPNNMDCGSTLLTILSLSKDFVAPLGLLAMTNNQFFEITDCIKDLNGKERILILEKIDG